MASSPSLRLSALAVIAATMVVLCQLSQSASVADLQPANFNRARRSLNDYWKRDWHPSYSRETRSWRMLPSYSPGVNEIVSQPKKRFMGVFNPNTIEALAAREARSRPMIHFG